MPIYNLYLTVDVPDAFGDRLEKHPTNELLLVDGDFVTDAELIEVRYLGE